MADRLGSRVAFVAQRVNCDLRFLAARLERGELFKVEREATAREIDLEVKKILDRAYVEAKEILTVHRDQVERVTAELLKGETLDRATFYRLIEREEPPMTRVMAPSEKHEPATAT